MNKFAYIKKLPNGQYRVLSKKDKNLGTYPSKSQAEKRLRQVEFFKHRDQNKADDIQIDLTAATDFSLSAIMRELNKCCSQEVVMQFLKLYKENFDQAHLNDLQKPEHIALQNTLVEFGKTNKILLNKDLVKNAALTELGEPILVGKYLANIIRFVLMRISEDNRPKAINSLKNKIYYLNENEIANKKMPASASMGQSITFIKHVLFSHDASYIRQVLNNIVKNL